MSGTRSPRTRTLGLLAVVAPLALAAAPPASVVPADDDPGVCVRAPWLIGDPYCVFVDTDALPDRP